MIKWLDDYKNIVKKVHFIYSVRGKKINQRPNEKQALKNHNPDMK